MKNKILIFIPLTLTLLLFQNCSPLSSLLIMSHISSASNNTTYSNPVSDFPCADPAAFHDSDKGGFYLACTGGRFPIRYSKNLVDWDWSGRMLVNPGKVETWAKEGRSWAPHIAKVKGNYIAYYTQNSSRHKGAIGVSTSRDMLKDSFKQRYKHPFVRSDYAGGVIDPSYFKDPSTGKHYLLYKVDGNSIYRNTSIMIREMGPYGLGFRDQPKTIKTGGNNLATLVEGQEMFKRGRFYYLFYSHGSYVDSYKVRVARSTSIYGPYTGDRTILSAKRGGRFYGPGHGTLINLKGRQFYFYHAYDKELNNSKRYAMVDRVFWKDEWPIINDGHPSEKEQYMPTSGETFFPAVSIRWKAAPLKNPHYSFDLITDRGERINACVDAGVIRGRRSLEFSGKCRNGKKTYRINSSFKFKLCAAENGRWRGKGKKVKCTDHYNFNRRLMNLKF